MVIKKSGWFLFLMLLGASCLDEPECFSLNNNIVGISFRKLSDGKADTVFIRSLTADGTDSTFRENVLLTGIDLPLDYYQNQTIYHFDGLAESFDLQFDYEAKAQFVSEECGERFVLDGLKVTTPAFIDSLRLLSATPKRNNTSGTHLQIYRCPNTSRAKLKFGAAVKIKDISTTYPASILLNEDAMTTVNIPLDITTNESSIRFTFTDETTQEEFTKDIVVSYSKAEKTLFSVCGPQIVLSDIAVVSTTFTTATAIRTTIQDPPLTNIEITF